MKRLIKPLSNIVAVMLFGVLPVQSNPTQNELKAEVKVEALEPLLLLPKENIASLSMGLKKNKSPI